MLKFSQCGAPQRAVDRTVGVSAALAAFGPGLRFVFGWNRRMQNKWTNQSVARAKTSFRASGSEQTVAIQPAG